MARNKPISLGAALALVLVLQVVIADDKCRTGCHGANEVFNYGVGKTYKYDLDSDIQISVSSAAGQHTGTEIKAKVSLTQLPECNQVLRIDDIQIIGSDKKVYKDIPDIHKPIVLNFHDGQVEDRICTEQEDNQNSLNIKRAIASLFQANLKHTHETDVFGLCPTDIASHKEGNTLVIDKKRNLNKCAFREHIKQEYLATAFNLDSEIKSSPVLDAVYSSRQNVKDGVLELAEVTEDYLFMPFSVGDKGAKAAVHTKLRLTGVAQGGAPAQCTAPRTIIFDNPHVVNNARGNVNSILAAVKDTMTSYDQTVHEDTAKEFVNLIKVLRTNKKDDLLAVYNQIRAGAGFPNKEVARKVFLDALLRAVSGDTIDVAIELLKNGELSETEEQLVYLGFSFARHVTEYTVKGAAQLLNKQQLPREAYLGIGTLVNRFCKEHSCKGVDSVHAIVQKLIAKLGDGKAANRADENNLIFVLKALGNIHHINDQVSTKIASIAQNKKSPNRLRVAALETYLSDPCKDQLRDSALTILKDIQQDSEVRIKAYLALAQCPNAKIGNAVKALLEHEPSYQVGGFIVSHIKNLRASANPDKQLARQHLGFLNLPARFPVDFRKHSFNGELSYTVDSLGLGNYVESNVIYSQDSFLPRSGSLNLTAEIFGHTFNFLEIDARQENLDQLLARYFGPEGSVKHGSLQEYVTAGEGFIKKVKQQIGEKFERILRSKREASKADVDAMKKQIQQKTSFLNKDLDLDLSLKMFGAELAFISWYDAAQKFGPEAIIDKIMAEIRSGVQGMKNFNKEFTSSMLFLDAELSYPTTLGFPLRLAVEGSTAMKINAAGAIDLSTIAKNEGTEEALAKLSLVPSANVEIAGRLTLDALVVEDGLKVRCNLYTATGLDLTVTRFGDYRGFDLKIGFPVEKQTLVSGKHEIVFHRREHGAVEVNTPIKFAQNKDFTICLDQLNPIIGMTFCGGFNGPNVAGKDVPVLPYPLSGDAKFEVTVARGDLSAYHIREELFTERNHFGGKFVIESLNRNNEKKISLEGEAFLTPAPYFKVGLISPIKRASVEGRFVDKLDEKSVFVKVTHDQHEYYGKAGLMVTENGPRSTSYRPIVEYKTPKDQGIKQSPYGVQGLINYELQQEGFKYTLDNVQIIAPNMKPITIAGILGKDKLALYADLTATNGAHSGSLNGRLQIDQDVFKTNLEMQNTIRPEYNFNMKTDVSAKKNHQQLDVSFQLTHGRDLASKVNVISFTSKNTFALRNEQDFDVETKNKLTYPAHNLKATIEYQHKPKLLEYEVKYECKHAKFGSELEAIFDKKSKGDYDIEFEIYGFNNKAEFKAENERLGDKNRLRNVLVVNGKTLELSGEVMYIIKPQNINIGADLDIKIPTRQAPYAVSFGFTLNPALLNTHQKISSGGKVFIDAFLKLNKDLNGNGLIKVNIEKILKVDGQLKSQKGSGNGHIVVDFLAIKRTVKADTAFTAARPQYNVEVNFYPMAKDQPDRKISVISQNTISQEEFATKSTFDIFGKRFEATGRLKNEGVWNNGQLDTEAELQLAGDRHLGFKLRRVARQQNDVFDLDGQLTLQHRQGNAAPQKVEVGGRYKNCNFKKRIFDIEYRFGLDDGQSRTLNAEYVAKRQPNGEGFDTELRGKLDGSVVKEPLEAAISANYKDYVGTYKGHASAGQFAVARVNGKYDLDGESRPYTGDVNVDVTTQSDFLRSLKTSFSGSVKEPKNPGDNLELQGTANIFADIKKIQSGPIDIKSQGQVNAGPKEGRIQGTVECSKHEPVSLTASYKIDEVRPGFGSAKADVEVSKGADKWRVNADLVRHEHASSVDLQLKTPVGKGTDLALRVTRPKDNSNAINTAAELRHEGKRWQLKGDFLVSEITPAVDVRYVCPAGKVRQFLARVTKSNEKQFGAEVKIVDQVKNFLLEGAIDANVENVEDFYVKISANSPALQIDDVVVEAHNKPANSGREIFVTAKSAGKDVLAGSTTYTAREENGKLIVEGSGSFKVKDETKTANFKYIRQNLSYEKNGERGIEISFDAGLGNKAVDAELRVTNKQFRILNSYCEEKKECAHIEFDSKTTQKGLYDFNNELEIAVDLRKLGLSHEFGLKSVTVKHGYLLDHTVDVHFQNEQHNKYQYSIYVHPKEAGVSLTTPKRIVALEAIADYPQSINQGANIKGEVNFYLDKKNQPNQKTALVASLDVSGEYKQATYVATLTDPVLRKPLEVRWTVKRLPGILGGAEVDGKIDIFEDPAAAIEVVAVAHADVNKDGLSYKRTVEVRSAGLQVDVKLHDEAVVSRKDMVASYKYAGNYAVGSSRYDNVVVARLAPRDAEFHVRALNVDVVNVKSLLKSVGPDSYVIDTAAHGYGLEPIASEFHIKEWNTADFLVYPKADPADQLKVHASLIFGKAAEFKAQHKESQLAAATIKLDEANFLKSHYSVDSKAINAVVLKIRDIAITYARELKKLGGELAEQASKESDNVMRVSAQVPSFRPVVQRYTSEAEKIKGEILADPTIKNMSELIQNVAAIIVRSVGQAIERFSEVVENVAKAFYNLFGESIKAIQKDVFPRIQHMADQICGLAAKIFESATDVATVIIAKVATILEEFQPEFQQIAALLGEIGNEISKAVGQLYRGVKEFIEVNGRKIYEEIRYSPLVDELQRIFHKYIEKYLPSKQALLFTFKDIMATFRDTAPTPEFKRFFQLISDYVEKKVMDKPCDDAAEIERIIQTGIEGARVFAAALLESGELPELQNFELPDMTHVWSKLPKLAAIRFSPITYLIRNDINGIAQFILSLMNHPKYWFPPYPLHAIIVQGQHIFTFDGKHITFPGKCNYLLAGDAAHQRFTFVGEYTNGLLTAITLADHQNTVSYKKGGHSTYNNAPTELPRRSPDLSLAIFREYGVIVLKSEAGVTVTCTLDLVACGVEVSGFYHGHIRGLLGNGNNEPYDDFMQPNGKIVPNEGTFANSYKMSQACPDVKTVDHHARHSTPACSKLFGEDSSFALCYPFVNPHNFRQACEHGIAANVKDTEQAIAVGYVAACSVRNIPISVPKEHLTCTNGEKPHQFGEAFKVKTPAKSADIVVVVDTASDNEVIYKELVQPLTQQLTNELHGKGISDVEYHVVAYGGQENRWPSHVTMGGKLQYKGRVPNLKFTEAFKWRPIKAECKYTEDIVNFLAGIKRDVDLVLGNTLEAKSFKEAYNYPFRAEAIKSVIVVSSKPCEIGSLFPLQILSSLFYDNDEINLNLVIPARFLDLKDQKHTRDVCGFNDENIFTISQAKKNPGGSSELYKDLVYNDYCIDFTLKNGGNVFMSDNFIRAKPPQRKQYVHAAVHNIAAQFVGIERELDCECGYINQYAARNTCKVVNIEDKRSKKGVRA